ncbi:hypothetical protein diail_10918 [Diaporthe ilicicola]|nr:hypothetical protein diail_10918 [Diaporthe ilicicola]
MRVSRERRAPEPPEASVWSKSLLRWALLPLAFIAVAVVLQHGIPGQDLMSVHARAAQLVLHSLWQSSSKGDDDCTNADTDRSSSVVVGTRSQSCPNQSTSNQSTFHNQSTHDIVVWHARTIEYGDLIKVEAIQPGRLEVVQHPGLGPDPVLVKRAGLPGDVKSIARETAFYRLLDGLGVTPLFLGHVAEAGHVVGFVAEYVQQQQRQEEAEEERAGSGTQEACMSALRRMHAREIAHGDAHGGNCLVREDGTAALVDFELAVEAGSREEFERDLWIMSHTTYTAGDN